MSTVVPAETAPRKQSESDRHGRGSQSGAARRIILAGLVLTALFVLVARLTGCRAELAETNYQANLIRLQDFLFGPKSKAVLVGSSITGRILPSYFEDSSLGPVSNLGLDGSGPPLGLQFCLARPVPIICVEVNTLLKDWDSNDTALQTATRSPAFRLARYVPAMRASMRPSSILYSWLKARRTGSAPIQTPKTEENQPEVRSAGVVLRKNTASADLVEKSILQLRQAGCKVVLVNVPAGPRFASGVVPSMNYARDLSRQFNLPLVDLQVECDKLNRNLSFTDGLHLSPGSAREVAEVLSRTLAQLPPSP